jgi:hypothetical protein
MKESKAMKESADRKRQHLLRATLLFVIVLPAAARAQTPTAFTYQGRLTDAGAHANGAYDLRFTLYNSETDAAAQGTQVINDVQVATGLFTVRLDFGVAPFNSGLARFLEIGVRAGASDGDFTTLAPRQPITSTPYALRASSAAQADAATTAADAFKLGGFEPGQYVRTTDTRLSNPRTPTAGSPDYIQNTTAQQAGANFNVGGNGTVSGTLTAATLRANTQFDLGSQRILAAPSNNTFVGKGTGFSNTGDGNTFVGRLAGAANMSGGNNTFVGFSAGGDIGQDNVTGSNNTFVGWRARPLAENLTNATAIGAGAAVRTSNSLVLGDANVSVGIGTDAPKAKLHVAGGHIYVSDDSYGVVLKSHGGSCFRLVVSDTGTLSAVKMPACP